MKNITLYGRNELDCLWIGKTDWHLSTNFDLDSEDYRESGFQAVLEFEIIDTVAEIFINGKSAGTSANLFHRIRLDLTGKLKSGENSLELIIRSPEDYTEIAASRLQYPIPHGNQFSDLAAAGG